MIGTCFTVIVVPEGILLARLLFVALVIADDVLPLVVCVALADKALSKAFLVMVVCPCCEFLLVGPCPDLFACSGDLGCGDVDFFKPVSCCCFLAAAKLFTIAVRVLVPLVPVLDDGFC